MMCLPAGLGLIGPVAVAGGAFPVYLSATATGFITAATSFAVPIPAVDAGDRLIMQFGTGQFGAGSVTTPPSGWTLMGTGLNGQVWGFYWWNAPSTQGATTVTVGINVSGRIAPIVHRIQSGTFDAETAPAFVSATISGNNPDPPSLAPAWGSADTLWIAAYVGVNAGTISVYPFAGMNTHITSGSTGSTHCESGSCWENNATGTLDPTAFTKSVNTNSRVATIAIKPV